jgi:hypothetical protein
MGDHLMDYNVERLSDDRFRITVFEGYLPDGLALAIRVLQQIQSEIPEEFWRLTEVEWFDDKATISYTRPMTEAEKAGHVEAERTHSYRAALQAVTKLRHELAEAEKTLAGIEPVEGITCHV